MGRALDAGVLGWAAGRRMEYAMAISAWAGWYSAAREECRPASGRDVQNRCPDV
jgi:hypothetical protein